MDAGPEIEAHRHHGSGRPVVDLILGVSAIAISLISLALEILHGNAMEPLVQANSWPFVMTMYSNAEPDGSSHFRLIMMNKGVGPARIESLEILAGGQPVASVDDIRRLVGEAARSTTLPFRRTSVQGTVLRPGDSVNVVDVPANGVSPALQGRLRDLSRRLQFRTCYCSVFDECWSLDSRDVHPHPRPRPVAICPTPAVPFKD